MQRFGTDTLRNRYARGRAALRWVLAQIVGVDPAWVPIERGERGRPRLASDIVDFNVTHTGDVALIGVSDRGRIGVDIERRDRPLNALRIARRILTARERAALPGDVEDARRRVIALWTCKEALAKATGDALSAPFGRIDIALDPTPALIDGPPPYDPLAFALFAARVPNEYVATVALWRRYNGIENERRESTH